jgi:omega-6 fatty acid desaturase (delta-12 desaturase)
MSALLAVKQQKRAIIDEYAWADNRKGLWQVANTLIPLILLWWLAVVSADLSWWLTAAVMVFITLFTLRALVLMHECGHGSMFATRRLNRNFGFVFGVLSSMPQYVWSQHHAFHHAHNGNWEKYRGPLTTPSVDEYAAMSNGRKRIYRYTRHVSMAPLGGLVYLILNPRFTWITGSLQMALFAVQHNFEHAYAVNGSDWDYDAGALHGTSFLVLPRWLNWFTANIG